MSTKSKDPADQETIAQLRIELEEKSEIIKLFENRYNRVHNEAMQFELANNKLQTALNAANQSNARLSEELAQLKGQDA
ncbi:MAG: hypothetical protein ACTHJR_11590 [Sphingomonas sp.]|uniref:hypothetical protein n=1 Tax=Sphingomonas sp. TaxID=28214 RepID=UPI003F801669